MLFAGIVCRFEAARGRSLYMPKYEERATVGGEYPGRGMSYSGRAVALRRPSVIEVGRRDVVSVGTRVCRQRSHLSGRATAWVEHYDRLRAVLGGSSMHVRPSYDEFEPQAVAAAGLSIWSSSSSCRCIISGAYSSLICQVRLRCLSSHLRSHTYISSSFTRYSKSALNPGR